MSPFKIAAASLVLAFAAATGGSPGLCDIYAAAGTPCVAAHSVVRSLYANYSGPLYQVQRTSDNTTLDVPVLTAGSYADSAAQDAFCGGDSCNITRIYDQSPQRNHLGVAPGGGNVRQADKPVNASASRFTANGHAVYAAFFERGMGYRQDNTTGVPTGNDPETILMVTSGTRYNDKCCFDYGNAERDNKDHGAGTMETINWGNSTHYAKGRGAGSGPWVMADLESGLWAGNEPLNPTNTPVLFEYVTAMVKGNTDSWTIKAGDATNGQLEVKFDGPRPPNYQPMKKQGAIVLGVGGDNSNGAIGTFYEGVLLAGYSSDAADDAAQSNIVAAGYGK